MDDIKEWLSQKKQEGVSKDVLNRVLKNEGYSEKEITQLLKEVGIENQENTQDLSSSQESSQFNQEEKEEDKLDEFSQETTTGQNKQEIEKELEQDSTNIKEKIPIPNDLNPAYIIAPVLLIAVIGGGIFAFTTMNSTCQAEYEINNIDVDEDDFLTSEITTEIEGAEEDEIQVKLEREFGNSLMSFNLDQNGIITQNGDTENIDIRLIDRTTEQTEIPEHASWPSTQEIENYDIVVTSNNCEGEQRLNLQQEL